MTALPSQWNAQLSIDHMIHERLNNYEAHVQEYSTMNSFTDSNIAKTIRLVS